METSKPQGASNVNTTYRRPFVYNEKLSTRQSAASRDPSEAQHEVSPIDKPSSFEGVETRPSLSLVPHGIAWLSLFGQRPQRDDVL